MVNDLRLKYPRTSEWKLAYKKIVLKESEKGIGKYETI